MATTTGGGLRAPLRPLVHVGGGVDRRAVYHEEQAALREALQRGTATIHGDRMLSPVVVTVSATSIVVMLFRHVDAPNYIGLLRRTCPRRSAMSAGTPRPCMRGRVEPTSLEEQPE